LIKYNLPSESSNVVYAEQIIVDRRVLIESLKNQIAQKLNLPIDGVIFRRGGSHGAELVEDDLTFKQANIYNGMSIFVQKGEPTRQGFKRVSLTLAEYYNPDWTNLTPDSTTGIIREPHDHEFFTFTDLGKLAVRTLDPVNKVKQSIGERLLEIYP